MLLDAIERAKRDVSDIKEREWNLFQVSKDHIRHSFLGKSPCLYEDKKVYCFIELSQTEVQSV